MAILFNADEIYAMAVQIERNGAEFYRKAAQGAGGKPAAKMLLELADMEDDHERTFTQMKDQLAESERTGQTFDPAGEGDLYLRAMVEGKIFDFTVKPADSLTGAEPLQSILQTAIGLEKDSVLFYVTMKGMVSTDSGKQRIDDIIRQELGHIGLLSKKLTSLA